MKKKNADGVLLNFCILRHLMSTMSSGNNLIPATSAKFIGSSTNLGVKHLNFSWKSISSFQLCVEQCAIQSNLDVIKPYF